MNDARYKLSANELMDLEDLNEIYRGFKRKAEMIEESTQIYPPSADNMWEYKHQVEDLQRCARELRELHLEVKMLLKNAEKMKVPDIQHFSDITDELMFRYRDMRRS
mmetsp:Transcript_7170/g.5439  ORF Transcript_7170/g.5439 Transcript_7170/m.5439 type:complete len:107 (+) Transcript_7170:1373-1693(+)